MSPKSIKASAASGVRWSGLASALRVVLMMARLAVLARLLEKRDFGVVTMVGMVLGYAQAYVDFGFSSSLIQKQERDPDKLATLFWLNVMAGFACSGLLIALREPVASLLKEPALVMLIPVAALQLPISAFGQQFDALFQRDLKFNVSATIQIIADIANTLLAIVLAYLGYGVWSLVLASLAGATLSSVTLFVLGVRRWPLRWAFRPKEIAPHLRFGAYQLGNVNLGYLTSNIDNMLIARLLGAEALGLYSVAQRLTQLPRRYINPVISKVAFPVFAAQKENRPQLAASLLSLQRSLSYVNLPLILGMLLVSPVLVPLVYGDKWLSAVPLVQILCVLALLNGVGGPTQIIRTALGHVRFNFHWTWMSGVLYAAAMWVAASQGLTAMIWARTAVGFVLGVVLIGITLRFIDSGLLAFLSTIREPALAGALMSTVVYLVMLVSAGLSDWLRLLLSVAAGAATFLGAAVLLDRKFIEKNARLLLGLQR